MTETETFILKRVTRFLGPRCAVCGDKIKPVRGTEDDVMIEARSTTGEILHVEECCLEYFEHGHPDMPGSRSHAIVWEK